MSEDEELNLPMYKRKSYKEMPATKDSIMYLLDRINKIEDTIKVIIKYRDVKNCANCANQNLCCIYYDDRKKERVCNHWRSEIRGR